MRKFICWLIVALSFNAYAVEFGSSTLSSSSIDKLPEKIVVIANYQEIPADVEQFDAQLLVINVLSMLEAILNEDLSNFSTQEQALPHVKDKLKKIEPKINTLINASLQASQLVNEFNLKKLPAVIINDCFVSEQTSVRAAISEWGRSDQCNAE